MTRYIATAAIFLIVSGSAYAATTPVDDWKRDGVSDANIVTISPDGLHEAYTQRDPSQAGASILVKDLSTGNVQTILTDAQGLPIAEPLTFSPDGRRLLFLTAASVNAPTKFDSALYTVAIDGSDLRRIAPGDPSTAAYCKSNPSARQGPITEAPECSLFTLPLASAAYSPDGSKILVGMVTNPGKRDAQGRLDIDSLQDNKRSFSIAEADSSQQDPQPAPDGAQFWSKDGSAIYLRKDGMLYRYDLRTSSTGDAIKGSDQAKPIIGTVPGADAVIVRSQTGIRVTPLSAETTPAAIAQALSTISPSDSDGRTLQRVQVSSQAQRVLLVYVASNGGDTHPSIHVQVLSF